MKRLGIALIACAALVTLSSSAAAQPEPFEYTVTVKGEAVKGSPGDHFLTFSGPVHVPEVTLAAGTYIFTVVAPSLVQVRSADRSQVLALFFTAPVLATDTGEDYAVALTRVGDRAPLRMTRWFLPNQSVGHELLYPPGVLAADR